jgi:hypothetical protein
VPGLLARFPDEQPDPHLLPADLEMAEKRADGRMKKKLLAAREAMTTGVARVVLADSRRAGPVQAALTGKGTVIADTRDTAGQLHPSLMERGAWPPAEVHSSTVATPALSPASTGMPYP